MSYAPDPRIDEAKAADVESLCERLGLVNLRRHAGELVGPCPNCGGNDRFAVRIRDGVFLCRQCDLAGGDVIALVRQVQNMSFPDALTWICGDRPADDAEIEKRRRRAREDREKRDRIAEKKRREAISAALEIWRQGKPATGSPVQAYLARRGIPKRALPAVPEALRYHPALPYMEWRSASREWVEIHKGPAMLGKITKPDGSFGAVHRTWIDLDQPGGKIKIERRGEWLGGNKGLYFDAKKTLGSMKGGTIRLAIPPSSSAMVVGEGIETTLTSLASGVFPSSASFLCGVSLGNMAGDRLPVEGKTGRPSKRLSPKPDLSDSEAFVPPAWVRELVFLQDGDSDPDFTEACLTAGLQRAMATRNLDKALIWPAPTGLDLNDLAPKGE